MIKRFIQFILTALIPLTTVAAHAVVIDFEEFAQPQELWGAGPTVSSKGFTFTYAPTAGEPYPTSLFFVGTSWRFNEGRTIALLANSCSAITTLKADDNSAFSLNGIDLGELNGPGAVTNVVFEATTASGMIVTHAVNIDGRVGVQRITFPAYFTNLTSVKWVQGDCLTNPPYLFDNVVLNATTSSNNGHGGTPPYGHAWGHHKDGEQYANPFGRK